MPIQVNCPACKRQLRVPDNLIGQVVKCPGCKEAFTAVADDPAPPPERQSQSQSQSSRRPEPEEDFREEEPAPERRIRRRDEDLGNDDDDDRGRGSRRRSRRNLAPHRGTLILVLGILSLVGAGIFTGIPAWIMGNNDLKEIRAGRMDPEGESNTNIGRILGMVCCIMSLVSLLICCPLWIIFGIAASNAGH
jgi:predicted Zn finger-like uncharacterized protein